MRRPVGGSTSDAASAAYERALAVYLTARPVIQNGQFYSKSFEEYMLKSRAGKTSCTASRNIADYSMTIYDPTTVNRA
jgi:hypothetical protein